MSHLKTKYQQRRNRYGIEVKNSDFLSLLENNEDIRRYCYRKNQFVVHYDRKCGKKKFKQLINGVGVIKTFRIEKKGKLENIYPEKDGWIHVHKLTKEQNFEGQLLNFQSEAK